jgi:hypothetical protein
MDELEAQQIQQAIEESKQQMGRKFTIAGNNPSRHDRRFLIQTEQHPPSNDLSNANQLHNSVSASDLNIDQSNNIVVHNKPNHHHSNNSMKI